MDEKMKNAELLYGQLEQLGINKNNILPEDFDKMMQGKMSGLIEFTIKDTQQSRDFLDKKNIEYRVEDNNIKFSGRIKPETYYMADDTKENRSILDNAKIQYDIIPEKGKIKWFKSTMAAVAIGLQNPIVGIVAITVNTIQIIAQKRALENSYKLRNPEIDALKRGEIIQHSDKDGIRYLRQLDPKTNTIISARVDSIEIPEKILDTKLTQYQKEQLKIGHHIKVQDYEGKDRYVKIDLLNDSSALKLVNKHGQDLRINKEEKEQLSSSIKMKL